MHFASLPYVANSIQAETDLVSFDFLEKRDHVC